MVQKQMMRVWVVCGLSVMWLVHTFAAGMTSIKATDAEMHIELDPSVSGVVRLLEINPFDTLSPFRGLTNDFPNCQHQDLSGEGFLRMTFLDSSPFDPQMKFPDYPVNADFVNQFSMRVRVTGTQGTNMPFRVFGFANVQFGYIEFTVPSDGAWHIVRADMSTLTGGQGWSGTQVIRIDPANNSTYAENQSAVVDIDWFSVTYRDNFVGDRSYTGLDVFVDLGVPESSWSGTAQPTISLPRHDGVRDRLFSKYVLIDANNDQIGFARYATDLSGISYLTDTTDRWFSINTNNGLPDPVASNGILVCEYDAAAPTWDPGVINGSEKADMDVAQEFAFKYRIKNYMGIQPAIPFRVFGFVAGESGWANQDDQLIPDGEWHVYRTTLDASTGGLTWHGSTAIRLDVPHGLLAVYPAADFDGARLELDWISVSDDPLFTPTKPLCDGGRLWAFSDDRTTPLMNPADFNGLAGVDVVDIVDLGCTSWKRNLKESVLFDLSLNPAMTWPVDEFDIGIDPVIIDNQLMPDIKYLSNNNVATYLVLLNGIQDYWLDEGTPDQRWNPVRNPLTVTNPPHDFAVAHNVMDPVGIAYLRASLEVLAYIFSDPSGGSGQIRNFIIGNELDVHWDWYNLGETDMETVVDIYLTACRIADLAVRRYHPDYRVYLSFTHFWNTALDNGLPLRYVPSKDFLELFAEKAREEGDFPWGFNIHPYPEVLGRADFWNDIEGIDDLDTDFITYKNLQVIRRYLQQEKMLYKGQVRPIILGEQGFHVPVDGDAMDEAIQAAAMAYSFKITEQVPGVVASLYNRQIDSSIPAGLFRFGLGPDDPAIAGLQLLRRRPSWQVMHDYGTTNETVTFDPYLSYLPISAWSDINLADIRLVYDFDEADPDISAARISPFLITNGICSGTISGVDPQILHLNVDTFGDGQESVLLRIKTEETGFWQLFWKTADGSPFSQERSLFFEVAASNDFQSYLLDLSANTNWVGQNITAWRLDPPPSAFSYSFEIDYLHFGPAIDFDGDGILDAEETLSDLDGDGLPNLADTDSNGNGYSDSRDALLGLDPLSEDADGDGISDEWELAFGIDPFDPEDFSMDEDGDGYHALSEYVSGTDPNNPLSFLYFNSFEYVPGIGAIASVDAQVDRIYSLLWTSNLVSGSWLPVMTTDRIQIAESIDLIDTNQLFSRMYKIQVTK